MTASRQPGPPHGVSLRPATLADIPAITRMQGDPEAEYAAAFSVRSAEELAAHWTRVLADPNVILRAVVCDDQVVGFAGAFWREDEREITYWIDRAHWRRGFATAAVTALLAEDATRPIHARVAHDNLGSVRVLEKCGFTRVGSEHGFAPARKEVIEELIFRLDA